MVNYFFKVLCLNAIDEMCLVAQHEGTKLADLHTRVGEIGPSPALVADDAELALHLPNGKLLLIIHHRSWSWSQNR